LNQYFFPDEDFRREVLWRYFNYRLRFGLHYGEVYATSPNIEGLVMWFLNHQLKITPWRILRCGGLKSVRKIGKKLLQKMLDFAHQCEKLRDDYLTSSYWYLSPIAVDPEHQGKGFASMLLRPMLRRFDIEQLPCLLETQSATNVAIYRHFGFEIVREMTLPGTSIPHFLMARQPKSLRKSS